MDLLQVKDISVEEAGNLVLQNISFNLLPLQKIAIAGETGSGKSTLLQTIAGFVQPSSGDVIFQNKKVIGPQDKLIPGHPGIAYLSQRFELPRFLRVEQVLRYASKLPASDAEKLYELCRINSLRQRRTDHLSGGEQQHIALAKLLLSSPKLLLLDEPFSNLDMGHKQILKTVIRDISDNLGITLVLVSHDPLDTLSWADGILVMKNGLVIQKGIPQDIYRHPGDEYTASLFGNYNLLSAAQAKILTSIPGIEPNDKKMLIRPEDFTFVSTGSNNIMAQVRQVKYFGSYYEVQVMLADANITIKTGSNSLEKGKTVYISLPPENVWYV